MKMVNKNLSVDHHYQQTSWLFCCLKHLQNDYNKTRYSNGEPQEFQQLIENKIRMAREELGGLTTALSSSNSNGDICKMTGTLIPAERLRAVPHTTMSMEAKLKQAS